MNIVAKDLGVICIAPNTKRVFNAAPSFDMEIDFEKLNYSSLLEDSY